MTVKTGTILESSANGTRLHLYNRGRRVKRAKTESERPFLHACSCLNQLSRAMEFSRRKIFQSDVCLALTKASIWKWRRLRRRESKKRNTERGRLKKVMQGHEGDVVGLVDGSVKELCCFLSKVNCARNQKEHNMDAFQYEQSVYFRTIRPIKRGEELLVRYGDVYEQQLGIDFNNPNAKSHFQQTQDGLYFCPLCNICFHSKEAFNNHKTILPCSSDKAYKKPGKPLYGTEKEPYVCSTCGQCYSDLCLLKYHMLDHDAPREFGCDQCFLRFFKEEHFQEHLKWCEPDFPT
ncbi:Oidioi.mRNA.OKI2018_I69.PAR.g10112.t1.cds [Oikopleura dioica]|uniref:Oidioi.mRNA.OKI2018_I69.PAR.g10112.t1.cds n=1 Tax=Oikopleura dioica TaxID=34765 RepID=A0ABN7RWN6_OIKDI|nr:Oidioi.mRNA.OKI2018_I69.PAR.g10112.t1.cds [Oikopleura dioica]